MTIEIPNKPWFAEFMTDAQLLNMFDNHEVLRELDYRTSPNTKRTYFRFKILDTQMETFIRLTNDFEEILLRMFTNVAEELTNGYGLSEGANQSPKEKDFIRFNQTAAGLAIRLEGGCYLQLSSGAPAEVVHHPDFVACMRFVMHHIASYLKMANFRADLRKDDLIRPEGFCWIKTEGVITGLIVQPSMI